MSCWKSWNRSLETNTLCKLWQLNSSKCVFIWPSDLLRPFPSHASCAWCRANVCNYPHHPFFSLAPLCAWSLLSSKFSGVMIETSASCCRCFLVEGRSYGCAWTKIWSLISLFETQQIIMYNGVHRWQWMWLGSKGDLYLYPMDFCPLKV